MGLLEREAELDLIAGALATARRGRGSTVLLSGPAGIGKSAVLAAARKDGVVSRLAARGGELERDFALGVVRQLFEPALDETDPASRERLLDGTGPAAGALKGRVGAGDGDASAILHGLYRLVANLAADGPLWLEVDDVQWADAASLRFLAFLARRLSALPVVLLLARRSGEPATDPAALHTLADLPETEERVLVALSPHAAARLVRDLTEATADERFCNACHAATGGNPFVLRELVRSLLERGVRPDAEGAMRVTETGPPTVARWVLRRLERLPEGAAELARAVAVLGEDATLGRAARLVHLALDEAEAALDGLIESELLAPGRPLDFVHPVVRAAVHDAMPAGSRSRVHRSAARLLRDEGAAPGRVATHLLVSEPGGERWVAEALLDAGHVALSQGAPEVAASQSRRALAEPSDADLRVRLLRALGNAERRLGVPSADERFLAALEATADPRERAETLLDMLITGTPATDVIALTRNTLHDVEAVDPGLALVLRARLLLALEYSGKPIGPDLRAAEHALARAREETLGTRLIAGVLGRDAAMHARPRRTVLALALRAVADEASYFADLRAGYPHMYALMALVFADELELAERRLIAAADESERRGSLVGGGIALFVLAHARRRRAELTAAEAAARSALELATRTSEEWLLAMAVAPLVEALTDRGELAAAEAVLDRHNLTTATAATPYHAQVALARSLLHLAAGRLDDALVDAADAGRFAEAVGVRNPITCPWRSRTALALIALGRRTEASAVAREDLAIAEVADIPSAIGAARRVLALATGGEAAVPLLQAAVAVLETAPVPLELARALVDLGAALRRAGRRSGSREPLARALELAHRHGAAPLAGHARIELLATGGRPRRVYRTGIAALTPSELRVAHLAAAGLSNADVAARLFITAKTAEHHLAAIYRKLDIRSRHQLPALLETSQLSDPAGAGVTPEPRPPS